MKTILIFMILVSQMLLAKEPISLMNIFKTTFNNDVMVGQKDIVLNANEKKSLQAKAKATIDSNKIRFYVAKKAQKVEGYGVMIIQRIRTKKAAILYLIDRDVKIKNIEILAFHEPSEYKPYNSWKESFTGKGKGDDLKSGYDIPTISGATLSARAITNASRIALEVVLKEIN